LTAAVLAHEIRNPLQALRFQLHSLRRNAGDPARVGTTADTIDSELERIQRLVQDYLAHEKAQAFHVQSVSLVEALQGLQTIMGALLKSNQTELAVPAGPDVVVWCDPHALRQILMNLALNAQQAMGPGGKITIGIRQDAGFGVISVADTGPGIPPEMIERLFKPFQTSKKEGSGIGLALVKRFADNFGGNASVESEVGKGSVFHVKLPLAETGMAEQARAVPSPSPSESGAA
ncbi:MAG: sensor histidine kinase, partial [Tepidisphaerales bacterium]